MAVSGAQLTRIGAGIAGIAKKLVILAKAVAGVSPSCVIAIDSPTNTVTINLPVNQVSIDHDC